MSRKIPAVTMVAACIRAETGVGPSIASGNHTCSPIREDFPTAPIRSKVQRICVCVLVYSCVCNRVSNLVLPNFFIIIIVLSKSAISPIRFIMMALAPDLFASVRVYQKFISK